MGAIVNDAVARWWRVANKPKVTQTAPGVYWLNGKRVNANGTPLSTKSKPKSVQAQLAARNRTGAANLAYKPTASYVGDVVAAGGRRIGDTRVNTAGKKYRWDGKKWVSWGNSWQKPSGSSPSGGSGGGSTGGIGGGGAVTGSTGGTRTTGTPVAPNLNQYSTALMDAIKNMAATSSKVYDEAAARYIPKALERSSFADEATALADAERAAGLAAFEKQKGELNRIYADAAARIAASRTQDIGQYNTETNDLQGRLAALSANMGLDVGQGTATNYGNFYGQRASGLADIQNEYALQNESVNRALSTGLEGVGADLAALEAAYPGTIQKYVSQLYGDWGNVYATQLGAAPDLISSYYASRMNPLNEQITALGSTLPNLATGQFTNELNLFEALNNLALSRSTLAEDTRRYNLDRADTNALNAQTLTKQNDDMLSAILGVLGTLGGSSQ